MISVLPPPAVNHLLHSFVSRPFYPLAPYLIISVLIPLFSAAFSILQSGNCFRITSSFMASISISTSSASSSAVLLVRDNSEYSQSAMFDLLLVGYCHQSIDLSYFGQQGPLFPSGSFPI